MNSPGFVSVVIEMARQTAVLLLQNRLLWVVAVAEVGCAVIAFLLGYRPPRHADGRLLYSMLAWWLLLSVLMPWVTMYFAVQAIHGDIEERTFQYLFLRPVRRSALLLGKWLAVALFGSVLTAIGAVILFLATLPHAELWVDGVQWSVLTAFVLAGVCGAVAYSAVGALFAAWTKRPLVWTAVFIVGMQYFIGNLPAKAGIRAITVADPVRRMVLDRVEPDRRLARWLWPSEREFDPEVIGQPVWNLVVITGVALALALRAYARSEYDARARE
ncbi:MAG: ABC transporter permease subunit [Planctomycetes bacterium]|nr:ABC transporter permease subunit [Planctomycetota bacterium]